MELSIFHSLTDIHPQKKELDDKGLQLFCKTIRGAPSKEKRSLLFSPNVYEAFSTRKKENIKYMTGIVFDIDHKKPTEEVIQDVIGKLPPIIVHTYTTWSHTFGIPRWRLIIPFQDKIEMKEWNNIFEKTYKLFDHPAVDMASKNPAAIYFAPYLKDTNSPFYSESWIEGRKYLTRKDLPTLAKKIQKQAVAVSHLNADVKIIDALNSIDADIAYDDWIKIGMALHHEWGDMAFPIWDNWSLRGHKYPRSGETSTKNHWKSFKTNGSPITIATLYKIAKDYGFNPKGESYFAGLKKNDFIEVHSKAEEVYPQEEEYEEIIDDKYFTFEPFDKADIYSIPSGVGKHLFDWFEQRALSKNPSYSLAASISLSGFILRNHMRTPTFLRTNFMILTIGHSGSGKTHALKGITEILGHLNLEKFYISRFGSYQGGLEVLEKNQGQLYLVQDEAAYEAKAHASKAVANHEMRIQELKMKLFSCQDITTDATKGDTVKVIKRPFYSEFSTTTAEILKYFSVESITSGFLPRYILIKSEERFFEENPTPNFQLTPALQDALREFINYSAVAFLKPTRFTFEAEQYFLSFKKFINNYIKKSREQDLKFDAVFARLAEHAHKLSLITAAKKSINGDVTYEINLEGIQWAISVIIFSARHLLNIMEESFFENIIEENHKRVLRIIKDLTRQAKPEDGEWITRSRIYQKCRFLNTQVLENLLERYQIENLIELRPGSRRGRGILVRVKHKGEEKNAD